MDSRTPETILTTAELVSVIARVKEQNERIAFVPTMGALHLGHLTLVKEAKRLADRVVVSIFVNPTQFGPNEDFAKYPRTFTEDLALLAPIGVDWVFAPSAASMYPSGFQTYVTNRSLATELDGAMRPGHFDGVLTVVLKLFNLIRPDVALFGKKDYQQWRLIDTMVSDLAIPVNVIGVDTVREHDGLALSSRNRYLSDEDRLKAPLIKQGLSAARAAYQQGQRGVEELVEICQKQLMHDFKVDYVVVRRARNLSTFGGPIDEPPVMLVAARLGTTRLIDNLELEDPHG